MSLRGPIYNLALILGATTLFLSGCSVGNPSPTEVLDKTSDSLDRLKSFSYQLDLNLSGSLISSFSERITSAHLKLAGISVNETEDSSAFTLTGNISANAQEGAVSLSGDMISLPDYIYFRLTNLTLPTLLPLSAGGDNRWYKIKQSTGEFADETGSRLGIASAPSTGITPRQMAEVRKVLSNYDVVSIVEVLPDATVGGVRAYHYRIKLEPTALTQASEEITKILGIERVTSEEIEKWSDYQAEVWIDKRSFHLVRLKVNDLYLNEGLPTAFDLTLDLARHNQSPKIEPPTNPEELNADKLIPGLPL